MWVRKEWLSLYYLLVLAPNVHLDMIYRCHVVVCFLDLYVTLGSPRLGRNYYVYIKVPECAAFTLLASSAHIASCHVSSNSAQRFQRRSRKSQKFKTTDRDDRRVFKIVYLNILFRCTKKLNKSTSITYINNSQKTKYII